MLQENTIGQITLNGGLVFSYVLILVYIDVKGRAKTSFHILTNPIYPKPVGHVFDEELQYDVV